MNYKRKKTNRKSGNTSGLKDKKKRGQLTNQTKENALESKKIITKLEQFADTNRNNLTSAEKQFSKWLNKMNIKYIMQYPITFENNKYQFILDFFIPKGNIAVEIDGGYHSTNTQSSKDKLRDKILQKHKFTVFRINNEYVFEWNDELSKILTNIWKKYSK